MMRQHLANAVRQLALPGGTILALSYLALLLVRRARAPRA